MNGDDGITPATSSPGGGDDIKERLARIETELKHVAKREDVKDMEAKIMRWLLTMVFGAGVATVAALVRTFL